MTRGEEVEEEAEAAAAVAVPPFADIIVIPGATEEVTSCDSVGGESTSMVDEVA